MIMKIDYAKFKMPVLAGLAVIFVGAFVAEWFYLYDIRYFDKLLHLSGGIISAWFFSVFFRKELGISSKFRAIIIILSATGFVGILWEFAEYISGAYVSQIAPIVAHYMFIGDLVDTLGDILTDLTGGLGFSLSLIFRLKCR